MHNKNELLNPGSNTDGTLLLFLSNILELFHFVYIFECCRVLLFLRGMEKSHVVFMRTKL